MNNYVSLSLTKKEVIRPPALRTFTPRRDQLVICGQHLHDFFRVSQLLCSDFPTFGHLHSQFLKHLAAAVFYIT
jgi:hypothetical protein